MLKKLFIISETGQTYLGRSLGSIFPNYVEHVCICLSRASEVKVISVKTDTFLLFC